MSRYIPPEEWTEEQIRKELDSDFKRWDTIAKEGCSDPFWPDGMNMNLVRNHIIFDYRLLAGKKEGAQLSLFEGGMDMTGERPIPPKVNEGYMVPTGIHLAERMERIGRCHEVTFEQENAPG